MATSIEEVAMNIRYRVELSEVERGELRAMLSGGKHAARKLKRAQILLAADAGVADETIAISLDVGVSTVCRVKRRFVEGGVERALNEEPRPGAARKLTGKEEALLVATACASPPEGRARWTLELLAGEMVRLTAHASLSRETVRRRLAENALKPWRQKMWCIPRVNGEFVARMEDVLDLYAEAPDPKRPVVCFDESPTQLIGEVRQRIPPEPGQVERFDYEYRRAGTVNLFVLVDAHRPWRKVTVTQQRTALDFARCMRELVEVDHPQAERVRVVLDNLSTHTPGALYEAFPAEEAHRLLRRLEFHFTPKHASWLNMAEIEIGVLKGQCLNRRIADRERLEREIAAWQRGRNAAEAKIEWMFTTEAARTKLGRFYPHPPVADLPGKLSSLLSGSGVVGTSRHQGGDEFTEEGLTPAPGVVHELEEGEVERQLLLREAAVGPEPGAQQGPDALHRVDVHLAEAVAVLVARVLAPGVTHGLVAVAPLFQPGVDVVLVGVDESVPGDRGPDDRLDRLLLDIGQHPQHHLPAAPDQAEDRRLVLRQRAAARRSRQPATPSRSPLVWGAPCQGQSAGGTLFPDAPRTGPWLTTGEGPPNLVSGRLASSRTLIPHPARSSAQADGTRLLDGG
jgi:transposase